MDTNRRFEIPGSEMKVFITYRTKWSIHVSIFILVILASKSHRSNIINPD